MLPLPPVTLLFSTVRMWRKCNFTPVILPFLSISLKFAQCSSSFSSFDTFSESLFEDYPTTEAAGVISSSAAYSVVGSSPYPSLSLPLSSSLITAVVPPPPTAGDSEEAAVAAAVPSLAEAEAPSLAPAASAPPVVPSNHAIVVVPGIAGSGLFARIRNANLPACASHAVTYEPFRIWAALSLLLPPPSHQKCWIEMMEQQVDKKGEVYQSRAGVELQVDDYGGIHAIDFLDYYMHDSYGIPGSAYMHGMLQTLRRLNYQPVSTLRGVPYDWRLPPWQFDYSRLKTDIEERYEATGQQKVDLLAHSLGTVILCYFFNKIVDQAWKNKYIKTFTLVGAATGGSFKAIKCLLSGYGTANDLNVWNILDVSFLPTALLRDLLRTMGSTYALLPDPQLYGNDYVVAKVARPQSSSAPSSSSAMSPPQGEIGSDGGKESSEFEEKEGVGIRGDREKEAGEKRRSGVVKILSEPGAPFRELRRRRLAAVEEQVEKFLADESDDTILDDSGSPHAEEEGRREQQQQQQQQEEEQLQWATLREYAARSRMSDEERQRHRNERLHAYVHEQQQRLEEAYDKMVKDNIPVDVYTLSNWTSLLPPDVQLRAKVAREKMSGVLADPGVPVRCVWSTYDAPTTEVSYVYENNDLDQMPIPVFGFGDDTVPVKSLSLCTSWPSTFEKHELKNVDHMYIFGNKSFNQLIESAYGSSALAHEDVAASLSSQPLASAILLTT